MVQEYLKANRSSCDGEPSWGKTNPASVKRLTNFGVTAESSCHADDNSSFVYIDMLMCIYVHVT